LLKKRGSLVFKQKLEEVVAKEREIDALTQANIAKYERPVACFVTFNTQEGYERCINHFETKETAFGYPIYRKDMKKEASLPKVAVDEESKVKLDESEDGFTLFGEEQAVQAAFEPSNIIWENLEIPIKTRNRNKCIVLFIVSFLLLFILVAVAALKVWATQYSLKYPKDWECA